MKVIYESGSALAWFILRLCHLTVVSLYKYKPLKNKLIRANVKVWEEGNSDMTVAIA
jgi:hypothetical protein